VYQTKQPHEIKKISSFNFIENLEHRLEILTEKFEEKNLSTLLEDLRAR